MVDLRYYFFLSVGARVVFCTKQKFGADHLGFDTVKVNARKWLVNVRNVVVRGPTGSAKLLWKADVANPIMEGS